MSEVVIIGGGVIGLSLAYELSSHEIDVTILERSALGKEASWAGAGILPSGNPEKASHPLGQLVGHSARLIQEWSEQLQKETAIDNGYLRCGGLELATSKNDVSELNHAVQGWRSEGLVVEDLSEEELRKIEPALSDDVIKGCRLPDEAQLRNPRHLKALASACLKRGVRFRTGAMVTELLTQSGRITAAKTWDGPVSGDQFVVTSGAWSAALLDSLEIKLKIRPVRGQMVLLRTDHVPFQHVLLEGSCYLVPRPDGRILVGSTEDDVGFDKRTTPQGVHQLLEFAFHLVPDLRHAHFERAWAGLRPGSEDGLPYLGASSQYSNLFVAAGHFRSGLQLSAATAMVMTEVILNRPPTVDLEVFSVERYS